MDVTAAHEGHDRPHRPRQDRAQLDQDRPPGQRRQEAVGRQQRAPDRGVVRQAGQDEVEVRELTRRGRDAGQLAAPHRLGARVVAPHLVTGLKPS